MRQLIAFVVLLVSVQVYADLDWSSALEGARRSDENKARDQYRNPRQTLEFFGLREGMTIVEISPGGGWYTEILAPLLKGNGKLYAAGASLNIWRSARAIV